jgi:hypothetical protein
MTPIYLDPTHPGFPSEASIPQSARADLRRQRVLWLWARLNELTGDCVLGLTLPEEGIVECAFPAMGAEELRHLLAKSQVFCTAGAGENSLRFTLSACQRVEDLDTLQAVVMNVLNIQ